MLKKTITQLSVIAITITFLLACQPNAKNDAETSNQSVLPTYFYKHLEGTLANKKIVMELNKMAGSFTLGSFYTEEDGNPIRLMLDTAIGTDSLVIRTYGNNADTSNIKLNLKWVGDGFTGNLIAKNGKTETLNLKEIYPEGSYRFTTDSLTESKPAFDNKPAGPKGRFFVQYVTYTGKNQDWVNEQLRLVDSVKNTDWKQGLQQQADSFFKSYLNDTKSISKDFPTNTPALNYELTNNQYISFNEKDFVSIEAYFYTFTGGAHGNYNSIFYNYDVAEKKLLTLSDIIKVDSVQLNKLAETYFRQQFKLKDNQPLNNILLDNTLKINNNFYINRKGINFLYNPYEIAAYAQGQINIFIPYSALKDYLQPNFKQRMGI